MGKPSLPFHAVKPIPPQMPSLTFAEPLDINAIVWITSVPRDEKGASRQMAESLQDLALAGGFPVFEHEVQTSQELFVLLADLAVEAKNGLRPIIHFDTHGNPDKGIYLEPSGDWASWPDLMDALRSINVATANNLVVVFALCYGLELYKLIELAKPVPAYLFAAPPEVVTVGFLLAEVPAFYRSVQAAGAFMEPFNDTLGKQMKLFNCQGLFVQALARYVRYYGRGEVLEERIRQAVRAKFEKDGVDQPAPEQVAFLTAQARRGLEPSARLIELYAPKFLIGRPPGFSYEEVELVAGPESPPANSTAV
jgi:hypothetical protein